jgi:hypothetical protein
VSWCPEQALNYPDVHVRMGHAALNGEKGAVFLGHVLRSGLAPGCQGGARQPSEWWDDVQSCDRYNGVCGDMGQRLDALVWGKYTHALDETWPAWNGDFIAQKLGGCDPQETYQLVWEYLDDRGVGLVPGVFGLETRTQDEPVGGQRQNNAAGSEWGDQGDVTLSEGMSIIERSFEVCDVSGTSFLMPTLPSFDPSAPNQVDPCAHALSGGAGEVEGPLYASRVYDFGTQSFTGSLPWDLDGICLVTATDAGNVVAVPDTTMCSSGTTGAARIKLDMTDPEVPMRLFALDFLAAIADKDAQVQFVVKTSAGQTVAQRQDIGRSDGASNNYHHTLGTSTLFPAEWVGFTFVFRAPPSTLYGVDADNDGITDTVTEAYVQVSAKVGNDFALDEVRLLEVDGQLLNLDADSVEDNDPGDCYLVDDNFGADLGWQPWFERLNPGGVDTYGGTVEVDTSDPTCPQLGDIVTLDYRTFAHQGLWPQVAERQASYIYSPGIFEPDYWTDALSPREQIVALSGVTLGRGVGNTNGPDDFILVSDLGGEVRGINRAWDELNTSTTDVLGGYYCALVDEVCSSLDSCANVPADGCLDPYAATFSGPCDCSSWDHTAPPAGPQNTLLIAGDMFTQWHNGGNPLYQLPHGGPVGVTYGTRSKLSNSLVAFLSWFHFDQRKGGKELVGHETILGFATDLASDGFRVIGAPGWDPDNARSWASLAAGTAAPNRPYTSWSVHGIAHYGWGSDEEGPLYMAQTAHYAWQAEWAAIYSYFLSNSAANPGGVEVSFQMSDMQLQSQGDLLFPIRGQNAVVLQDHGFWSHNPVLLEPDWIPLEDNAGVGPLYRWSGHSWAKAMVRFYAELPAYCDPVVEFSFWDDQGNATTVTSTAKTWGPSVVDRPLRALSASAPYEMDGGSGTLVAFNVTIRFEPSPVLPSPQGACVGATLDNPTLYQGLPVADFPYRWTEQAIDTEWTSSQAVDATETICGSATYSVAACGATRTFSP